MAALIAVTAVVAFVLLMERSRLGKSLRAAADNPEAAIYMGIDVDRAHRLAFGFGVAHDRASVAGCSPRAVRSSPTSASSTSS